MDKKPKLLHDSDPWILGEEIPDCDVFFFQIPLSSFTNDSSYPFLKNYKKALVHYKGFHMDFYMAEKDSIVVAESIVDELVKRPSFGNDINKNISIWSYKLIDFAKEVSILPLKTFSNRQLWDIYKRHDILHTKLYTYGWIPVAADLFHNNLTSRLKSYLYTACGTKQEAEAAFVILTTPSKKTLIAEEREEFLNIYTRYKNKVSKPSLEFIQALKNHTKNWGHLGYIYAGNVKPFDSIHYLKEMKEFAETGISAKKILKKESQQLIVAKRKQAILHKKWKISKQYQNLFETAREFSLTKLIRRHAQLFALLSLHTSLLEEISKRFNMQRKLVQFMLIDEVKKGLLESSIPSQLKMKERFKESIFFTEKSFENIYTGAEMKKVTKKLGRVFDKNQTEITGQTAQPGYAKGTARLIFRAKDIPKMNKGDILISIATDPDVVPAMKKAAAIVTEQGGITSHAAIVSRELGIPCIIGTKIATKIFKDGDMVEVDATKGIVRKL